jgi:CBS-domain-containing membrane protein
MPTTLKGLFENIPLEAMMIENWVRKRLVLVGDNQPLDKALQRLNRHKITSIPIVNEQTGGILGILESLDIVNYLSTVLDQDTINRGAARWDFNMMNCGQLLNTSNKKCTVMSNSANMYEALRILSRGEHCVMVIDGVCHTHLQDGEEHNILGVFTQSDVIRFFSNNPYWIKMLPNFCKRLNEIGIIGNNTEQLCTVDQNVLAYEAFQMIANSNCSGLAVLDGQRKLVAHLSASNIRGINRTNFQLLRRPLFEFLQRDRRRGWWTMPICLNASDTLEKAVLQFGGTRVHQMYVCDTDGKPRHVVTLTDILRQFVPEEDQPKNA